MRQQNLNVSVNFLWRQHSYTVSETHCYHKTMMFLVKPSRYTINVPGIKEELVCGLLEFPSPLPECSLSYPSALSLSY